MEQEAQMEITFNLFIHESNSITRSKKNLSLSNIKQKFHRIFKTSLSHCEAGNVFDLHVNVIMPVLKLSSCPANSFILLRVLSTGVFLKSFFFISQLILSHPTSPPGDSK